MSLRLLVTKKCKSFDLHRTTTGKLKTKKSISREDLLAYLIGWVGEIKYGLIEASRGACTT